MNNTLQVQLKASSIFDLKSNIFNEIGSTKNGTDTFSFKDALENNFKDNEKSSYSDSFKSNNSPSSYNDSVNDSVRQETNQASPAEEKYVREETHSDSKDCTAEHKIDDSRFNKEDSRQVKDDTKNEQNATEHVEKNMNRRHEETENTEKTQKSAHNEDEKKTNTDDEKADKNKKTVRSTDDLTNLKISSMSANLMNNILNHNVKSEIISESAAKQTAASKTFSKNKSKTNSKSSTNVKNETATANKADAETKKSETASSQDTKKTNTENANTSENANKVNSKLAQKLENDTGVKISNLVYEVKVGHDSTEKGGEDISLLKNLADNSRVVNIRKDAAAADKAHDLKTSINDAARLEGLKTKDVQEVKTSGTVASELKVTGADVKDAALKNFSSNSNNNQDAKSGNQQQQNINMNMSANNLKNQPQTSTAQAQNLASNTNTANINIIQEILNRTQNVLKNESAADQSSKNLSVDFEAGSFGQMHLSLKHTGSSLSVSLEVSSDSSKDSLMNQRDDLEKEMRNMGFKDVSVDISTNRENKERQQNKNKKGNEEIENVKLAGDDKFDMSQVLNSAR